MIARKIGVLAVLLVTTAACERGGDGGERSARGSSAKEESSVVVAANTPAAEAAETAFGTEADFEEEAETTLNVDDIDGALDAIEKEIGP